MLNQIILVGRLTKNIVVNKSDNGVKVATLSLAIPRSFKNSEGLYDTDFIDCVMFDNIAKNTAEYCNKGDIFTYGQSFKKEKYYYFNNLINYIFIRYFNFYLLYIK